jgi:hypothetical protein
MRFNSTDNPAFWDLNSSSSAFAMGSAAAIRWVRRSGSRWFYFPQLERNEVILLKCYDSKEDGRAHFTAHSAFEDPTRGPDAASRESIEVRALVFWLAEGDA